MRLTNHQRPRLTKSGPSEAKHGHKETENEQGNRLASSEHDESADHQGHTRGKKAVAQDTDTLEKRAETTPTFSRRAAHRQ